MPDPLDPPTTPSALRELRARRASMIADLAELVAVESPSADETATAASAEVVAALGARLLGSAARREGNHLIWSHGATRVLLVGHHDTVWPIGTLSRWPFTVDGDRATGPGCFDMKAGLVQMFHALSLLPSLDAVTIVVNADEEIGSPSSRSLIEQAARSATAALVCEPSADGALKTARKGLARYRLEITGRAAHAGLDPASGANAGVELAHQVLAIATFGDGDTTVTPTVLTAGTTANTVPAAASVAVDARAFDAAEFDRVDRAMRGLRPVLAGTRLTVHGGVDRQALPGSASTRLYRRVCAVAADLGLPEPGSAAVGGASDGNITAGLGVPTLDGLGPVGGNAHADGEWVDVAAMGDRAAILTTLVAQLLAEVAAPR